MIVLTANHYFLDAVGGFIILGIGYLVAQRHDACRHRRRMPTRRAPATA